MEASVRPFLKWAGGKTQLLPELSKRVPTCMATYVEPFLGGGALFFACQRRPAILADANTRLIRTYRAVRDSVDELVEALRSYEAEHQKDPARCYYVQRAGGQDIDEFDDVSVAAWMIYLNKTGFNGLYRVNKKGQFNNPFGRQNARVRQPVICDEKNLRACARALAGVTLWNSDFRGLASVVGAGDFVYLDPPYVPVSDTASFTSYTAEGFRSRDQEDLADLAAWWRAQGAAVLMSNAGVEQVADLYRSRGFVVDTVKARRAINGRADRRGPVDEVLAWGGGLPAVAGETAGAGQRLEG